MFTKSEQQETFRFSNYLGLSFSLSCYNFGRAPPHSLPPGSFPLHSSSTAHGFREPRGEALRLRAAVLPRQKCHVQRQGWLHELGLSHPYHEEGAGWCWQRRAGHQCCCSLAPLPNTGQRVRCIPARQRLEPEQCCSYVQHLAFSADEIPPCIAAGRATSRPAQPMPIGPVPTAPCFPRGYNAARALTPLRQHPAVLVGRSAAGGIAGLSRPAGLAAPCPTPRCGSPARTSSGA